MNVQEHNQNTSTEEVHDNYTTTDGYSSRSSSTTTTNGRNTPEFERLMNEIRKANEHLPYLAKLYHDAIGRQLNRIISQEMASMMRDGIPPEYIEYALQEAAAAPQPSWAYAKAVIRRLKRERVPAEEVFFKSSFTYW